MKDLEGAKAAGEWALSWSDGKGPKTLSITGEGDTLDASVGASKFKAKLDGEHLLALPPSTLFGEGQGNARVSAVVRGDAMEGYRDLADGRRARFTGRRTGAAKAPAAKKDDKAVASAIPAYRGYPAGEYGRAGLPAQDEFVIRNATVWTNTAQGVLQNADVLVKNGKIAAVGIDLAAGGTEIDGTGKHVTPGIIDAIRTSRSRRRQRRVARRHHAKCASATCIDPTDINIYRQLAGGVTTANLLHGSANPIGGQNAGDQAPLGARRRRAACSRARSPASSSRSARTSSSPTGADDFTTRYPQTRMGVEAVMRDHFNAARDYARETRPRRRSRPRAATCAWKRCAEILDGERLVHCHSYRAGRDPACSRASRRSSASRSATFQHVLEGYKVADEIGRARRRRLDVRRLVGLQDGSARRHPVQRRADDARRRAHVVQLRQRRAGAPPQHRGRQGHALRRPRPKRRRSSWSRSTRRIQLRIDDKVGSIAAGKDADLVSVVRPPAVELRARRADHDRRPHVLRPPRRRRHAGQHRHERERLIQKALSDRSRALSLGGEDKKDDDKKDDDKKAPAMDADWFVEHAAQRGLYHNGADLMSCGQHDHAH